MATIVVGKSDGQWRALCEERQIAAAPCKACIVNAITGIMKFSTKYTTLLILNEDGTRQYIPIGDVNAGTTKEGV